MMDKLRLAIATYLVWCGARIAPRPIDNLFNAYAEMLAGFPDQLRQGREFGCITIPWSLGPESRFGAFALQNAAINALTKRRAELEAA